MEKIIPITHAEALADYKIKLHFEDNTQKTIDLKPFLKEGVSSALKEVSFFRQVKIENGYLCWPNGYDICAVTAYEGLSN